LPLDVAGHETDEARDRLRCALLFELDDDDPLSRIESCVELACASNIDRWEYGIRHEGLHKNWLMGRTV
jgi:hypothetical protein